MTTINKPLPHRPFSLALDQGKPPRRHQPQMASVSNPRPPYVRPNDKYTVPPVPKRVHLVTRSPSPPYYRPSPDVFPSSKPSHSFSQSQSVPHSSTSDLVPPHLKPVRSPSFWRRHWFVILICILALLGTSVAVGVVLANGNRASPDSGVYNPASTSSSVIVPISEAPVGSVSVGSATISTASPVTSASGSTTSSSRTPLPSATSSRPS